MKSIGRAFRSGLENATTENARKTCPAPVHAPTMLPEGTVSDMKESDTVDNNIEQSQESAEAPVVVSRDELSRVHEIASQLIETLRDIPEGDLVGEIVANALKLLRDHTNRGDIKLIDKSFKELRYALKVFAPFRDVHKVSIFGSARTPETHADYKQAAEFARKMAGSGWMVITGAGGGIMAA